MTPRIIHCHRYSVNTMITAVLLFCCCCRLQQSSHAFAVVPFSPRWRGGTSSAQQRRHCQTARSPRLVLHDDDGSSTTVLLEHRHWHEETKEEATTTTSSWLDYSKATMDDSSSSSSSIEESVAVATTTTTATTTPNNDNNNNNQIWQARWLLLGAAALYGTNFSVVKILDDELPVVGIAAMLRFGIASLCTLPWLLKPSSKSSITTDSSSLYYMDDSARGAIVSGFEVGLWNSMGYLAQAVGLQTVDASKSAFLCSLAVIVVPFLEFITGKSLKLRQVMGAIMAVAGVGFLELGGGDSSSLLQLSPGDYLSLLQPVAFGVAFYRMESAMRKYPKEANRNSAAQVLAVFCVSLVFSFVTEHDALMNIPQIMSWLGNFQILGALFWTGTITTALTLYMEACALKTLSASETTVLLSAEPLFGALFASLLIGETFGMDAVAGAGLIVVGCLVSSLGLPGGLLNNTHGKVDRDNGKDASYTSMLEASQQQQLEEDNNQEEASLVMKVGLAGAASSFVAGAAGAAEMVSTEDLELLDEVVRSSSEML